MELKKGFGIKMFLPKGTLAILFAAMILLSIVPMAPLVHADSGVVLWNKLGSQTEIGNSEVGPDGTIYGSGISFVPGKFGNGFTAGGRTTGPNFGSWEVINPNYNLTGTVEFWWKPARDYDEPDSPPDELFVHGVWSDRPYPFVLLYRWREGSGGMGGFDFIVYNNATTDEYSVFRTGKVAPFQAGDWVHVAYVWDMNGLPNHPEVYYGTYVNGQYYPLVDYYDPGASINVTMAKAAGAYFSMGYYDADWYNRLEGVLDNVMIWNYAKTDFSDRFIESPCYVDVEAGADQTVAEGVSVSFSGSFTAPCADVDTIEWDFGDGGTATGTLTPTHAYGDNGVYTVTLTVTDEDGREGSDTLTVTVNNVAPAEEPLNTYTTDENTPVTLTGTATDPGSDDLTFTWDWGDGTSDTVTIYYNNGVSPDPYPSPEINPMDVTDVVSHIYGDNGLFTITLTVTDDDGGSTTVQTTVTVINVAPIVDPLPTMAIDAGDTVSVTGHATDPGSDDITFEWSWEDGSACDKTTTYLNAPPNTDPYPSPEINPRDVTESASCVYANAGVYTVTLTVTDDDGGVGSDSSTFNVNYNIGWLPPITTKEEFQLKNGSTLPIKFNATNCNNEFVSDTTVKVEVINSGDTWQTFVYGEGRDFVRIDTSEPSQPLYICNLHTKKLGMPLGEYTIEVSFNGVFCDSIGFTLLESGAGKGKGTKK